MPYDRQAALDFLKRAINKVKDARSNLNDMSTIMIDAEIPSGSLKKAWDHLGEALSAMQRWALDNK